MASRQYIGARYVPRFMGEYDNTTVYEGLDVVDNGAGTSYIARKPVPAGTPLTDTTYWAVYGASSGAVIQLQNDVSALTGRVGNIESDLRERTELVLIGDSWAETDSNNYIPLTLEEQLGVTVHNYAQGGTGFDVAGGYFDQAQDYIDDTSFDHSLVKAYVLVIGLNVWHQEVSASNFSAKLTQLGQILKGEFDAPVYWFHNYSVDGVKHGSDNAFIDLFYPQWDYYDSIKAYLHSDIIATPTWGWVSQWDSSLYHLTAGASRRFGANMAGIIAGGAPPQFYDPYCEMAGTIDTTQDVVKSVPTKFHFLNGKLWVELKIALDAINKCNNMYINYDHRMPAKVSANQYVAFGDIIAATGTSQTIRLSTQLAALKDTSFSGSGRITTWLATEDF